MTSWSEWTWDDAQKVYYRARKGPKGTWQYDFSKPMETTTIRDMGPKYAAIPSNNAIPVKAPSYLLQSSINAGGELVALCADLTVFEPEPRRVVQRPRNTNVPAAQVKRPESARSGLVMEKGTERARRERRSQRKNGVTRVHDWRTRLNEW